MSTGTYGPKSRPFEAQSSIKRTCVYCGSITSLTKDHVPPKSIFPHPLPNDLKTVPCCKKCNKGFEKDDQYFATVLSLRANMQDSTLGRALLEKNLRGLRRPAESKFRHYIRNSLTLFPVISDGGIYLGNTPGIRVDSMRLRRIMIRITKAFAWINGVTCNNSDFSIHFFDWVRGRVFDDPNIQDIFEQFAASDRHGTRDQVFSYKYLTASDDGKYASIWLFSFYKKMHCIVFNTSV